MISYCLVSSLFTPKVRILRRGRVYVLGRDSRADFPLPSDIISRRHAEVQWSPQGGFMIRDMKSKNGTRVNDVPVIDTRVLADGDRIAVGPFSLQYREYQGDISQLVAEAGEEAADATAALSRDLIAQAQMNPAAAAGFAGNFAGHELLEIIRLLALSEKDGVLTIRGEQLTGQLGFGVGEIRSAITPSKRGEDAAFDLLSLPHGRFEFVNGPMGASNCRVKTEGILMEVARRMDEGASKNPPPLPRLPASQEGSSTAQITTLMPDDDFEAELDRRAKLEEEAKKKKKQP